MKRGGKIAEEGAPSADRALVQGCAMIAVFLTFGLVLESFHLVKLPFYLDVRLRRELWTLAHAHGTLLGVVLVAVSLAAPRLLDDPRRWGAASRRLRLGALLVPAGFLLGGIGAAEGDPSPFILLVPAGALVLLAGLVPLLRGR